LEKSLAEAILQHWHKFAPNITWDNVIGYFPITPYYTANLARNFGPQHGNYASIDTTPPQLTRFIPLLELSSGRRSIKNLYATGTSWHPGSGAQAYQGYNVYKVMAEDFGLGKPWEEKTRPY
jgi:phytoene dehydrogenase-like protein